jgi:hypothetical protein
VRQHQQRQQLVLAKGHSRNNQSPGESDYTACEHDRYHSDLEPKQCDG